MWFPTTAGMRPGDGSMAAIVAVPEDDLVPLPDGVDPVLVAALGLSAVAAHMALTWRGELAEGEQVIVLGGGGVVGQAAIQLARAAGARRVVAGARSAAGRRHGRRRPARTRWWRSTRPMWTNWPPRFASAVDGPVDLVLDPLFGSAGRGGGPVAAARRPAG